MEDTLGHTKKMELSKGAYEPGNVGIKEALDLLGKRLDSISWKVRRESRGEVIVPANLKDLVLKDLKEMGFDHFVALTCIDQLEESKFDLIYHLWSYGSKGLIMVKTSIDREEPSISSAVSIFRPAITYEREIREMFGIDFPGNPRLTQFILEDWEGPPPMKKDFNSIRYSIEHFDMEVRYPKSLPPDLIKKGGEKDG